MLDFQLSEFILEDLLLFLEGDILIVVEVVGFLQPEDVILCIGEFEFQVLDDLALFFLLL